nr:MAG: ORF1 [Torque teno midi virus]
MPFWWRRRRKPWYGRYRYRRRFQRNKTRHKRRRRFTRRRNRYSTRRRRKRRYKVRRKRQKIILKQWQPESINKCKIVGFSTLVLGAEGRQFISWTNEASDFIPPKAPGGGGFGCELITLEWLYHEYLAHNNIWTRSNQYKDLCRYTGCEITLFRHPTTDFIVAYNIQPPFTINKLTYPDMQPQNMLLKKHHRVIFSKLTKPSGKLKVKLKIKPPKQMSTRWFFQKEFSDAGLVMLQASACNFRFPRISPLAQSQMVTVYYINEGFYPSPIWGQASSSPYYPVVTWTGTWKFTNKDAKPPYTDWTLKNNTWQQSEQGYYQSINRDGGWFDPHVLNAKTVKYNNSIIGNLPIHTARYNPNVDTGQGNVVYAVSILQSSYDPPQVQSDYVIRGQPLWMAFYGFWSWIKYTSKDKFFMDHYAFVVKSPAIRPITQTTAQKRYLFLDPEFIAGKLPWDEYLSDNIKKLWYPSCTKQTKTLNAFVECGPYIPRYTNITESTWELDYKYKFYFKWGGPQVTDKAVDDPQYQPDYPVPGVFKQTVQISDPKTLETETMLHEWDFRRGFVTQTALKRMSENFESETDNESYDSTAPRKRLKVTKEIPQINQKEEEIKACLQQLCEKSTCQETPETLQQLIEQQQQQQKQLKLNLLKLLTHLKKGQRHLGLQTGLLE